MSAYLTKSDLVACLECRTKMYYRKTGYPSRLVDDEYMQFLSDGGYVVEFIAKATYPDHVDLAQERDPLKAFQETKHLVGTGKEVVFGAAAIAGRCYVRTDILQIEGNVLKVVEVKSASLKDEGGGSSPFLNAKGAIAAKWKNYLIDVAFQTHVLRQAFPQCTVRPYLTVINKAHRAVQAETARSEERRVGKECRSRWSQYN